ncbi:MAG: Na+/H+ antiporter subunit E [Armatimonadetes bacterium]|nr:Na+/H+ antiporter subunit E [Armatimonadota bacterium]
MRVFLWNLLLALTWTAVTGRFTLSNLALGFALGYLALRFSGLVGRAAYGSRIRRVIEFLLFYFWELLLANLRVAYDVLTPRHHMRPGILAIPLDARTDGEIAILANLITLTPGTLSLDVSDDRQVLYIHATYVDEVEAFRQRLKEKLERRVLEVTR